MAAQRSLPAPALPCPADQHPLSLPSAPLSTLRCRYGFLVQVLVLPLHMEFTRSGEFSVKDRLAAAARCAPAGISVLAAAAGSTYSSVAACRLPQRLC
jgi:hypothetical protein